MNISACLSPLCYALCGSTVEAFRLLSKITRYVTPLTPLQYDSSRLSMSIALTLDREKISPGLTENSLERAWIGSRADE
jgi:hypothetical protein